jgi:signal peptidase I
MTSLVRFIGTITLAVSLLLGCSSRTDEMIVFQGTSMLPSIADGEKIRVERFNPNSNFMVNRGDVVAFLYPKDTSKFYIKRVIGLPGETIEIREGKVIIDGKDLSEAYVESKRNLSRVSNAPTKVGDDSYYVLGDNRDTSSDSRIWGLVPKRNIFAKAIDK